MDWSYDAWPSGEPYDWMGCRREGEWDLIDYHVDLGCGRIKKGRIGIDHRPAPGVNIVMDLNTLGVYSTADKPREDAPAGRPQTMRGETFALSRGLPFDDSSIESIISHHALEHIGNGFMELINEVYRVLKPDGIFYAITPLFPSASAVSDADHKRYFMETTWDAFCGTPGPDDDPQSCWLASFSVPYTQARFHKVHQDMSPPTPVEKMWTKEDAREIRVALRAMK